MPIRLRSELGLTDDDEILITWARRWSCRDPAAINNYWKYTGIREPVRSPSLSTEQSVASRKR